MANDINDGFLSALATTYAGFKQAGAQSDLADFSASALDANSIIARMQAQRALEVGRVNETKSRIATRQMIGTQRANMAAQGIDVNKAGDSSVDVQADTAGLGEIDALTIRNNAALTAWGFNVQANDLTRQAGMKRAAGRVTSRGTLLTTGLQLSKFLPKSYLDTSSALTPTNQDGIDVKSISADFLEEEG